MNCTVALSPGSLIFSMYARLHIEKLGISMGARLLYTSINVYPVSSRTSTFPLSLLARPGGILCIQLASLSDTHLKYNVLVYTL